MARVLIVCAQRYNGHELWTTLGILRSRGHVFDVASTGLIIYDEITFVPNRIELLVGSDGLDLSAYDALMVVSGNMQDTERYWKDRTVLGYVDWFNSRSFPIAAICCSVPTVRGAAFGRRVAFFPLVRSRELLVSAGAVPSSLAMVRDGSLVTAEHQMATQIWVSEFCNLLEGKPPEFVLRDSGFTPRGSPRKPIPILEQIKAAAARIS
jgi:putative intracellular protease/amidase